MTHLPFMMQLAIDQPSRGCGHALMATCPPQPFTSLPSDSVFGHGHGHNKPHSNDTVHIQSQQTWTLSKGDLATLLDLSAGLGLGRDGEITPVTAWSLLMSHPRLPELELNDLKAIARALEDKIRCFG